MKILKSIKNVIVKLLVAFMLGFAKSFGSMPYKDEEQNKKEIGLDK